MMQHNVEALLEQAAQSSELPGWSDQLQWLVNSTLSRFRTVQALSDEALSSLAAGTGIPDSEDGKQKE